jgi:3-hydroxyisobutyrate dehydrogenase
LVKEMIISAEARFGSNADHTEMAKLCELLAGDELKSA